MKWTLFTIKTIVLDRYHYWEHWSEQYSRYRLVSLVGIITESTEANTIHSSLCTSYKLTENFGYATKAVKHMCTGYQGWICICKCVPLSDPQSEGYGGKVMVFVTKSVKTQTHIIVQSQVSQSDQNNITYFHFRSVYQIVVLYFKV